MDSEDIDRLNIGVFGYIMSQTSDDERVSLLQIQRFISRRFSTYVYLEIGSYLGGSIQPHMHDDRCLKIYSIDPRPATQADIRMPLYSPIYKNNTTVNMLELLRNIGGSKADKIECIESRSIEIMPSIIKHHPHLCFIDGEHTEKAVIEDFYFCVAVAEDECIIVFHDYPLLIQAIDNIVDQMCVDGRIIAPMKLNGQLFAIFKNIKNIVL